MSSERAAPPFVHVFASSSRWYAYDVNSNGLLEVDGALGRTLLALTSAEPTRALERLAAESGREPVAGALAEIARARGEEGLFLARRPRIAPRRLADADRAAYDTRLSHLILAVTDDCNLACRYCPQAAARARPGATRPRPMPRETALRALAHFAARCGDTASPAVSFYGGEPLLRPGLIADVVRTARAHHEWPELRFIIDTNGTLLDDDAADLIARERLHLQISLDGPRAAHDRWRVFPDGRGSHAAVLAGLRRLLRRDPSAADRLSFQVTAAPPIDLDLLAAWFGDRRAFGELGFAGPPHVRVHFANLAACVPAGAGADAVSSPRPSRARARWLDACASGRRDRLDPLTRGLLDPAAIRFYHRPRHALPEAVVPGGCCLPGQRRLLATADGGYEPCERTAARLTIGNVAGGPDCVRVESLVAAFSRAVGERCRGCWAVRLCGLCYAALEPAGRRQELVLREEICVDARQQAESMLRLYADLTARGAAAGAFLTDTRLA